MNDREFSNIEIFETSRKGIIQWRTQNFFSGRGVSTNSVEDRGQRGQGSGVVAP
jgi:hypothetical protein